MHLGSVRPTQTETATGWFALKSSSHIHGPQRKNLNNLGGLLKVTLAINNQKYFSKYDSVQLFSWFSKWGRSSSVGHHEIMENVLLKFKIVLKIWSRIFNRYLGHFAKGGPWPANGAVKWECHMAKFRKPCSELFWICDSEIIWKTKLCHKVEKHLRF